MANRVEAQAFGLEPERLHHQFFDREGAASGYVDAETAEELIGASKHVRSQAAAEWGQDLDFMAATDTNGGTRTVAMSYISGERAKARKRRSAEREGSTQLSGDGPGQPRLIRVHNAMRGVHITGPALDEMRQNEDYMKAVRTRQAVNTAECLLTLRELGYGGAPLGDGGNSPLAKASSTVARICKEHDTFEQAGFALGGTTIASFNMGPPNIHRDSVSAGREPTAELVTTRWAQMLSAVPLAQRAALLAAARQHQPYLSMSVWLRRSLTMDITPGRGLGIVPGTEEDHAVPVPLRSACGDGDLERGLTRSLAQSLRPDDAAQDDAPSFEDSYERRSGLRERPHRGTGGGDGAANGDAATDSRRRRQRGPPESAATALVAATGGPRQAAGGGQQPPQRQGGRVRAAPNRLDPNPRAAPVQQQLPFHRQPGVARPDRGWGHARQNMRSGAFY